MWGYWRQIMLEIKPWHSRITNENVIYEAVTDTNDSSYLVTLDQIYDIVGEEDWIHCESNCLVNLASSQMIMFSWGAKKKERKEQRRVLFDESLQVGNLVVVENHGNQWPHKAQIVDIDIIRSSTMSVTTLILFQIILKCMI